MSDNMIAYAMVFIGIFLFAGVYSLYRQGLKVGAVFCGIGGVMALFAGVMWW
ncbi:hypothetical protein OIE66_26020 [Nonomuraea sp. NBC_01738]|uniref:hypothetical protein n=1 Tax=Nonomuraea sp. NBC_01738 TaxID=2976003 RepID=UPI002E14469B|nr:hypothetical protein OIE66_26020 [Nonomuraea sp. NBC_01738]